ncbi:MAG: LuxR C-terminal-related transcriptional regulator [Methylacidiphilales bacterium]|nr:LuxR C-terminal-related transcriptional regulator [Candidatus Methylacidiphilales bacterium]
MNNVKVIIIDANKISMEQVKELISEHGELIHVSRVFTSLSEVREYCRASFPDALFCNLDMSEFGSSQTLRSISKMSGHIAIIGYLTNFNALFLSYAERNKYLDAVISPTTSKSEIKKCYQTVMLKKGSKTTKKKFFSSEVKKFLKDCKNNPKYTKLFSFMEILSSRELDIFLLLYCKLRNIQMAKCLKVSEKTISSHKTNILKKGNVRSFDQLKIKINYLVEPNQSNILNAIDKFKKSHND